MSGFVSVLDVQSSTSSVCPTNHKIGRRVDTQTVKAMLNPPLNVLRSVEYRFCPDSNCPTVYYSADGIQTFAESDLRERVYQKHLNEGDVFVCYCFKHTPAKISNEFRETGKTSVIESINDGIRLGLCACDIRNPQGSCCLGNVNNLVKKIQAVQ